jgi:Na+-transporting methylmalonyl-CoA/oxaloacetate decarboxylase gamma subunit
MLENVLLAIQITLVGMGLVFAAILLLWIVMAGLVHLARDRQSPAEPGSSELPVPAPAPGRELMRQAAAIAVAVALAHQAEGQVGAFPIADTNTVTAWQAVTRARQLSQRGARR